MSKHIQNIKIKNFKGITQSEANLKGHHIYLTGANGTGKSSFIDAAWSCLTGRNLPGKPITQGKSEGEVEIDLGDYVAMLTMLDGRAPTFRLESKDHGRVERPREVMNDLLGIIDFNPTEFFALSDSKQVEYFCKVIGVDFAVLDAKYKELYDDRTTNNKEIARHKADLQDFDPEDARKAPVNVGELWEKINESDKRAREIELAREVIISKSGQVEELLKQVDQLKNEINDSNLWIREHTPIDASNERKQVEVADETNLKINFAKDMAEKKDMIMTHSNEVTRIETEMADIVGKKKETIEGSMNIEGLKFDGSRFLLNDLPFSDNQINTAAQVITGLKIGAQLLREVKILRLDASLIDDKNFTEVKAWAEANDIQLFVEQIDRSSDKLTITIEEEAISNGVD